MKNAIWSTYYHYSSNDDNPKHQNCPRDENSWCEWQKAAIKGEFKSFKHSYAALPTDVLVAVKPIYEDLSKDSLLERCVKGFTQNNNESLNQIIWKITPKILSDATKEGRIIRRQAKNSAEDILEDSACLYGPGINDSV
ncbi:hypothetical protein TKK_0005560 [Trichogramma kaykai]